MVILSGASADLHMAQLMPLPLIVSCFSKIQIGFTFLVPAHPGSAEQRAVKRVCVILPIYKSVPCLRLYSNKPGRLAVPVLQQVLHPRSQVRRLLSLLSRRRLRPKKERLLSRHPAAGKRLHGMLQRTDV